MIFPEFKFRWFAEEIDEILNKELDFRIEVRNAERCRVMMNKNHPDILIPKNYLDLCREKVIVMEFVEGVPIMDIK